MRRDFEAIVKHFRFRGQFLDAGSYGHGNINDTYLARFRGSDGAIRHYILQRINHEVFKKPEQVMYNFKRVSEHLRRKVIAAGGDPGRETITLVPTLEGKSFYRTPAGAYWRAQTFVEGARSLRSSENLDHHYGAAKAFGRFLGLLADFPTGEIYTTIADFHHTGKRLQALLQALERDRAKRARLVSREVDFILNRSDEAEMLIDLCERGILPERVTHNDTKFDNVMIDDETGEGVCVIDLDTVMPGLSAYDFGDGVRFAANPAAEGERDLSKVHLDLEIYDRWAQGFLEATRDVLSSAEVDALSYGARLMTYEVGMRFLTDYLNGDVYFKVREADHNLHRCRTQLKLLADMERKFDRMVEIVHSYC